MGVGLGGRRGGGIGRQRGSGVGCSLVGEHGEGSRVEGFDECDTAASSPRALGR